MSNDITGAWNEMVEGLAKATENRRRLQSKPGRIARMPIIEFSDDADYDGLFTVLAKADFLYDFVLTDGTVHTGRFHGNEDDTMQVAIYKDSDPTGAIASFHTDYLQKVVYL